MVEPLRLAGLGLTTAFGPGLAAALAAWDSEDPARALRACDRFFNHDFDPQVLGMAEGRDPAPLAERLPALLAEAMADLTAQCPGWTTAGPPGLALLLPEGGVDLPTAQALREGPLAALGAGWPEPAVFSEGPPSLALWAEAAAASDPRPWLVLAADSLATPERLRTMDAARRLFSRRNPHGLIPGEAAAALLFLPQGPDRLRIAGAASETEPVPEWAEADTDFRAHSLAAHRACAGTLPDLWLTDWNNSRYRASQTAHAVLRVAPKAEVIHPVLPFGDCGAVQGPLALAAALAARPAGQPARALATACNGRGLCAALRLDMG